MTSLRLDGRVPFVRKLPEANEHHSQKDFDADEFVGVSGTLNDSNGRMLNVDRSPVNVPNDWNGAKRLNGWNDSHSATICIL